MNMYHVTSIENLESIMKIGIAPSYKNNGLMSKRDKKTYLTNSLKYIKIMAEDIAHWEQYVILKVDADMDKLTLIWWKGKGYKEWTTNNIIEPSRIKVFKLVI